MAFDKIQTQAIDVDTAPVKGSVNNSDYVLIRDVTTGDLQRILVSDLLAGSAGSIRLHGEADMTASGTTQTKIVISGDSDNAYIEQGKAPVNVSPNGIAYIVKAPHGGVQTQISGITETVNNDDQIVWTGSKWSILSLGSQVSSVNGRTGDVTGLAEADDVYTKVESDSKYYNKSEVYSKTEADSRFVDETDKYDLKANLPTNTTDAKVGISVGQTGVGDTGDYGAYSTVLTAAPNPTARNFQFMINNGGQNFQFRTGHVAAPSSTHYYPWNTVYHTGNKPTAADVGAIAVEDAYTKAEVDTIKSSLQSNIDSKISEVPSTLQDADTLFTQGKHTMHVLSNTNPNGLRGQRALLHIQNGNGGFQLAARSINNEYHIRAASSNDGAVGPWERLYTTEYKPTPQDIGALPANTQLFSGNYKDLQGIPTYFPTSWSNIDGKPNTFPPSVHNHNNLYYTKQEIDNKDYLTKAVADTEYAKISHNHNSVYYRKPEVDTKLNSKFDKSGGTIGNTVISSSHADAKLTLQRTDLDHHVEMAFLDGSGNITYFGTTKNGTLAYGDSANLSASGAEIYSTKNKPTASDVGALTQSQGDSRYLQKSGLGTLTLSTGGDSEINMHAGTNKNVTLRMWEAAQRHGAYIQYRGAGDNNTVFGTYDNKNPTQYMYVKRGTPDVYINGKLSVEGHVVEIGNKTRISSSSNNRFAITSTDNHKTGYFGARNSSWFHMQTDATSGFYSYNDFNLSNLYVRGTVSSGSFSKGNKAIQVRHDFYDSTWGRNGSAAYMVNAGDSRGAHWAFASYYDGSNIRAGIQILTNSDGRMRFYTNRRKNYVEVHSGQVFAGSGQSSASNAYTRKDYVDSKIAALPKARPSDVIVGNDGTDRTSGVRQGNVTWYARNWSGKTTQSSNLFTWVSPTTGFKVVNSGIYEIEATDARRTRSSGQDDQVSMRIQVNGATKTGNSCRGRDNDVINITSRWTGHLSAGQTVRFISSGGQIAVGGAHFKMRYIRP